jgi:hypothetical protein
MTRFFKFKGGDLEIYLLASRPVELNFHSHNIAEEMLMVKEQVNDF